MEGSKPTLYKFLRFVWMGEWVTRIDLSTFVGNMNMEEILFK